MNHPVVIIGGGVSGLTVAYRLTQAKIPYLLLEAADHFGGNIETVTREGYLYDVGPDSFLRAKRAGEELCLELGLGSQLITPQEQGTSVLVAYDGALHPMPEGLSMGVPKRPWPVLMTPLLSPFGKCRALLEPWIPARKQTEEESILQFLTRRIGVEMAERLAAPLLAGVFAGDARQLSMDAAFGQLLLLEKKYGSLFSGMNQGKSPFRVLLEPPGHVASPFVSLRFGMGSLIAALLSRIPEAQRKLGERVLRVERSAVGTFHLHTSLMKREAGALVVAGPPWMAQQLLASLDQELGEALSQIRGHSTATVYFALQENQMEAPPTGSGFIVPPGEGDILAATFVGSKWQGRAPEGRVLLRAFVGGARMDISSLSDEQLRELAHRELTRFLGSLGPVEFSAVHRYEKGTPQPELGHKQRLSCIQAGLSRVPGLSLLGSGYGAVGIPDCIAQANETARTLSEA